MKDKALHLSHESLVGRYVVAVSGGIDSVVLLDILAKRAHATDDLELVVAHFDHGIRSDSAQDALFVEGLARSYGLAFETTRQEFGAGASEDLARTRRYVFLRSVAKEHNARIVTAHHSDDSIETIAINLQRGTGWRGLAVMDSDVFRPLLDVSKQEISDYAASHSLEWREDSTNASDDYLRNRIRRKTAALPSDYKRQLLALRTQQVFLKRQIDDEVSGLIRGDEAFSRYFFTQLDQATAVECLRRAVDARLTRPQLIRALLAIKTARPGAIYQAGGSVTFRFTSRNFKVELIK